MMQAIKHLGAAAAIATALLLPGLSPAHAQAVSDTTYAVQEGDTLFRIAQEAGVSVRALQAWNDLEDATIAVGDTLRIRPPRRPAAQEPSPEDASEGDARTEDEAHGRTLADELPPVDPAPDEEAPDTISSDAIPADSEPAPEPGPESTTQDIPDAQLVDRPEQATWMELALRTGVPADSLWRLNDRPEALPDRVRVPSVAASQQTHVVDEGETLYSIAGTYGVSVRALQATNDLEGTELRIDQRLRIPGRQPEIADTWAAPDTIRATTFPAAFAGRLTASGATYDPDELVASHPELPFGSVVLLSHPLEGNADTNADVNHVFVRIVDRSVDGPEISAAAGALLGIEREAALGFRTVWRPAP